MPSFLSDKQYSGISKKPVHLKNPYNSGPILSNSFKFTNTPGKRTCAFYLQTSRYSHSPITKCEKSRLSSPSKFKVNLPFQRSNCKRLTVKNLGVFFVDLTAKNNSSGGNSVRLKKDCLFVKIIINLLAECNCIKLLLHRLMEPFTNAISLWTSGFGPTVINVFQRQIELLFIVPLKASTRSSF